MLRHLGKAIIELFYPSHCESCTTLIDYHEILCPLCVSSLEPVVSTVIPVAKNVGIIVHALTKYDGVIRSLILKKHYGERYPFQALGLLVIKSFSGQVGQASCFIPVPQYWKRTWIRGFNQAELLAESYASIVSVPVLHGIQRVRATDFQAKFKREERFANIKDAFSITFTDDEIINHITNKHVVLVDDVMTTGATLTEVALLLAPYKPLRITALLVARNT